MRLNFQRPQWKYKHTVFLLISIVLFFALFRTAPVEEFLSNVGSYGYLGAIIAGIFFVLTFTVVPATVVLFHIGATLGSPATAFFAGIGAVMGDYLIFRFLRDRVFEELQPIFLRCGGAAIARCLKRPYLRWLAPVLGALIIASPFPDEIGIGLMGISRVKNWQFLIISFFLNSLGILLLLGIKSLFII